MQLARDLRVLRSLILAPATGATHAARLNGFYRGQAEDYDDFRQRLLQGRRQMIRQATAEPGRIWVDLGAGTGANLEYTSGDLHQWQRIYLVDLCPALQEIAAASSGMPGATWRSSRPTPPSLCRRKVSPTW